MDGTILSLASIANGVFKLVFPAVYLAQQQALATMKEAIAAKELLKAQAEAAIATANASARSISAIPSGLPTGLPSGLPTGLPSGLPTGLPKGLPKGLPSGLQTGLIKGNPMHKGGAMGVSTEGQILGATALAILAGGGLKAIIDYIVTE